METSTGLCDLTEIGARWRQDSSLEKWFPISAEEIDRLKSEVERLTQIIRKSHAMLQHSAYMVTPSVLTIRAVLDELRA